MIMQLITQELIVGLVFFAIASLGLPYIALGALQLQVSRKKSESKDIEKFLKSLTGLSHFLFLGSKGHIVFANISRRTLHQDLNFLVGLSGIRLWINLAIPFIAGALWASVPLFFWVQFILWADLDTRIFGSVSFVLYIILVINSLTFGREL